MGNLFGSKKGLGLIIIVVALIVGAIMMFGGGNNPEQGSVGDDGYGLGRVYAAAQVDQSGCPAQTADQFYSNETIYTGLTNSTIPGGTELFMRLYYEGQPVEDTDPVVARQEETGCVWFAFEPVSGGFQPGEYEAQLIVNGNPADSVRFEVGGVAGQRPNPVTGGRSAAGVELGRMYTTTEVDQNGCAVDDAAEFYPDEPVYVSFAESYIPAGTEMFARLVYEGQPVEDTEPIVADREIQSCVWFVFEPVGQGFQPGRYAAEVYVNGQLADTLDFDVR